MYLYLTCHMIISKYNHKYECTMQMQMVHEQF